MTAPAGHAGLPDADAIKRLVEEVLRRLQGQAAVSPVGPAPAAGAGVSIAGGVVTEAVIAGLPAGTRHITVTARAAITPSARDAAAAAGIVIVRGGNAAGGGAATRPFVVAHATCPGDARSRAASIARAVPAAQQIPASGLADVVAAIAVHASRDAARAILLTGRPAAAVVLANRSTGLRAVTARDPRTLVAAAVECAANLLVVDPTTFTAGSLERTCAEFAKSPAGSVPAELAAPPAPCSCKSHDH